MPGEVVAVDDDYFPDSWKEHGFREFGWMGHGHGGRAQMDIIGNHKRALQLVFSPNKYYADLTVRNKKDVIINVDGGNHEKDRYNIDVSDKGDIIINTSRTVELSVRDNLKTSDGNIYINCNSFVMDSKSVTVLADKGDITIVAQDKVYVYGMLRAQNITIVCNEFEFWNCKLESTMGDIAVYTNIMEVSTSVDIAGQLKTKGAIKLNYTSMTLTPDNED